jgi:hypothetical protein
MNVNDALQSAVPTISGKFIRIVLVPIDCQRVRC